MRRRLGRLLPDSLVGQLILVTLLGIGMLQGMNYFTVCDIQQTYRALAEKTRAETTASYYLLLNGMDDADRQGAIDSLMSVGRSPKSGLTLTLLAGRPGWEPDAAPDARNALALFRRNLADCCSAAAEDARTRIVAGDARDNTENPLLQAALRLDGGRWVAITQPLLLDDQKVLWAQRLTVVLALLLFGSILIALLVRVTRPLCRMSCVADSFGRHPEGECPLPETGSREVREAAHSFNRMRGRILDNLAERRRMLAAMGHDLRTPLTRAKLRLEEIEPESLREKFAANLSDIQSIVEQGLELAGSLHTSEQPVMLDIVAFVESLVDDADEQGLPVRLLSLPEEKRPLVAPACPLCLKRCLDNLIANAVAYGEGASIAITTQPEAVVIDILDDGPGIPEELLEKVFEPYYRLEGSRNRDSGGAGLGLSIARNMASLSHARLTLENRPEGGLRARLTLPRAKDGK